MSKRIARQSRRKREKLKQERDWKPLVVLCSLLCLTLGLGVMAQWKALPGTSSPLAFAPAPPGNYNANSPSKEYIYAGGRLIATEEPTPTPNPTPTPAPPSMVDVYWMNMVGVTASYSSGSALTKTAVAGWNAGAISTKAISSGDGFVQLKAAAVKSQACGLSNGDTSQDLDDIAFAFFLSDGNGTNGGVYVYESGTYKGYFGSYTAGTTFKVAVESGAVKYYRNGVLLYTSAIAPTYPLLVDTALYTESSTLQEVKLSGTLVNSLPTELVAWTAVSTSTLTASGNNLTKTGSPGWNAGAISNRAISSGNGFVEFTTGEAKNKTCGLSRGNTNLDFDDIDYAFYLSDGNGTTGGIYVYEGGVYKGYYGSYTAGTTFRVAVEFGEIKYYVNGIKVYSHTITASPAYPLLVDTALSDTGATIQNVIIGGTLQSAP